MLKYARHLPYLHKEHFRFKHNKEPGIFKHAFVTSHKVYCLKYAANYIIQQLKLEIIYAIFFKHLFKFNSTIDIIIIVV